MAAGPGVSLGVGALLDARALAFASLYGQTGYRVPCQQRAVWSSERGNKAHEKNVTRFSCTSRVSGAVLKNLSHFRSS